MQEEKERICRFIDAFERRYGRKPKSEDAEGDPKKRVILPNSVIRHGQDSTEVMIRDLSGVDTDNAWAYGQTATDSTRSIFVHLAREIQINPPRKRTT